MKSFSSKIVVLVVFVLIFSMLPISSFLNFSKAAEPTPVFTDSFENKLNTTSSLTSTYYKKTIKSSNEISYVKGKSGMAVHLDSLSSYVGYNNKYINPKAGTIRFYFKPDSNVYTFYNTRQPEWKNFETLEPAFSGIMLDSAEYSPDSEMSSFGTNISFSGDPNDKNISIIFTTWSASSWRDAAFTTKNDFVLSSDKFYDFAFTWSESEGTIKLYLDGKLKATAIFKTPVSNAEIFFLGQNPFKDYWPYGPHSLIGTYDELRIYNTALKDFGTSTPQETPTGTTIIKLVVGKSTFTVNGKSKTLDSPPVIKNGRTLLPIRPVIESLGGTVAWDSVARKVTIKLGSTTIELWIDKKNAKVNGVTKTLDVAPQIINGRTMVPVRFVSENLGAKVDWDDKTKTITITYSGGTVAGAVEKTFTSSGGELTLSDGTRLTVPAGAFATDTKVSIAPSNFGKDSKGVDISGMQNLKGEITLTFTVDKGLSKDNISIFGFDPNTESAFDVTNSYNSTTGLVTVKISPSTFTSDYQAHLLSSSLPNMTGLKERFKIFFEKTEEHTATKKDLLIPMPYYGQVGKGCWAAAASMLLRGYMGPLPHETMSKLMNYIKVSDKDFGINITQFTESLTRYLYVYTDGKAVAWKGFTDADHMKWEILRQLDLGRPVLLRYLKSGTNHVVLVIGYKDGGNSIIIHDPQDITPNGENGTMYTVMPWSWVEKHLFKPLLWAGQLIWVEAPVSSAKSLQTIECSGQDESKGNPFGYVTFYVTNPRISTDSNVTIATLQFKPSSTSGYIWQRAGDEVSNVSSQATKLSLKLPVWNAAFEDKTLTVETHISQGATKIYSNEKNISIGKASYNTVNEVIYILDIPLEQVRNFSIADASGNQKITIWVTLKDGTVEKDMFYIDAKLSLIPIVSSVDPTSGKVGDTITINGYGFGKTKSSKSRVTINGKNVDIVSWSDKEIKVKLTQDVGSGPVVVYTGEKYEYKSNDNVIFDGGGIPIGGKYKFEFTVPAWVGWKREWSALRLIRFNLIFKNGVITVDPEEEQNAYNYVKITSGKYDNQGNISFTFSYSKQDPPDSRMISGTVITNATFKGKFIQPKFGSTWTNFSGDVTGKMRQFQVTTDHKNIDDFDITVDFKGTEVMGTCLDY